MFVIFLLVEHINSGQHRDILSQLRPEEKWQTYKQWTTPWHTQPAPVRRKMTNI
jgi:hypothetical protein